MLFSIVATTTSLATPYWIAWEGDDWPENQGWTRSYGTFNNPGGGQAVRTLADGLLYIDSMQGLGVYDNLIMDRPGATDPGVGEMFVAEWRLRVDAVTAWPYVWDPRVGVASDEKRLALIVFSVDRVWDVSTNVEVPIAPDVFHTYRFESHDMRTYRLFIDEMLVLDGTFVVGVVPSRISWGDGLAPSESRSSWDYFRCGVVPEAGSICHVGVVTAVFVLASRRR